MSPKTLEELKELRDAVRRELAIVSEQSPCTIAVPTRWIKARRNLSDALVAHVDGLLEAAERALNKKEQP